MDLRDALRIADIHRLADEGEGQVRGHFFIDRDFRRTEDDANYEIQEQFLAWLGDRKLALTGFDSETSSLVIYTADDSAESRDALLATIDLWNEWIAEGGLCAAA